MSRPRSKAGLFLMEMIIVIFFFSICAAICVNIFANAKVTAEKSVTLNNAVVRSANLAEVYKSADGDLVKVAEIIEHLDDPDVADIVGDEEQVAVKYEDKMIVRIMENEPGRSRISAWANALDGTADEVYDLEVRTATGGERS